MNRVVQNIGPEQWLQRPPIHHVTGTLEEFVDVELHSGVLKDANRPVLVEVHEHINVAYCAGIAPCHGAEHRGVCNSKPPELNLVGPECFQNVMEIRLHRPPRVYQTPSGLGGQREGAVFMEVAHL